jgi:hypothetical protein
MRTLHGRIAVALVAVAIAATAWLVGDGGGARAAIGQATGPLVATVPGDSAILVARDLAPGGSQAGEVTVTNVGDAAGDFSLSANGLADAGAPLSGVLELSVDDLTAARGLYSGPLSGLSSVALGTLAQGEAHRYRFVVSYPAGRPDELDNAYQGASTQVTFVWSASAIAAPSGSGHSPSPPGPSAAAPVTAADDGRVAHSAIGAALHQRGAHGRVTTWVSCAAACRIELSGTASFGSRKVRLRSVRARLDAAGRVHLHVKLPTVVRAAVARGQRVTVRLRAKATIGSRVVVTRRTIVVRRRA